MKLLALHIHPSSSDSLGERLGHPGHVWCFCIFVAALAEMESTLLSVVTERKSQRNKSVFVDSLIQSTLTERQVNAPETLGKLLRL